jgi:hypothetical protein
MLHILQNVMVCHRMSVVQHFRMVVPSLSASSMILPMKALQYFTVPGITHCYIPEDLFLQLGCHDLKL